MFFVFSCKNQTNNQTDKPNIPPDIPPKQDEIVITVSGDSNVKIAQSPSFNVLKNSNWADVKANQKISFSDGFILKSWHLTNKDGKLLVDTEVFTENTTVFAVSQTDIPPQQDEIVVTVSGDSNVKIAQSPSFNVLKNSTWASVKVKADQKISFSDGFILKSWHLTNKDGKLLVDTEVFTENTTIFAISEKENSPEEPEKPVKDDDGNEIKEEIIGEEGKDKEVKAIIEVVEVKEEGKEKPTTKLKISGNILSDETKRIADILRLKVYKYKNKKDELKSIEFAALTNNSTLNIQFKDESKKINVEDLKILVAKIPNQVKIDNEETITLDKSANITSIKGEIDLTNLTKTSNNATLTKWEFISNKIKEQSSINSDNLTIKATGNKTFLKENLEKVAKTLTKTSITGTQNIELNKEAELTSISGNIKLADLTKGTKTGDVNISEFISDKIQTAGANQKISTGSLIINSNESENFNTESLKKVANTLSKTEITNTTTNGNQTVTLGQDAKISSINGNIALKDIVDAKDETNTKLANYIAYKLKNTPSTESPSGDLKINTFYKKPSTTQGSSLSLRGNNNEPESTPITPSNLKDIKNSAFNNATFNFEYNGQIQDVNFNSYQGITEEQKQKDYFDITDFSKDITTGILKDIQNIPENKIEGNIFLRGDRLEERQGRKDITPYPKVSELVSLIQNEKLNKKINVGSVILAGNVKPLLKLIIDGKVKESDGGIRFVDYGETLCTGDLKTGFLGNNNDILPANQLIEYYKRADNNSIQIENSIITGLDQETTKNIEFVGDMLTNVNFQGCDLSNLSFNAVQTGNGYLKFENSTLPMSMANSSINILILKDVKFPKEKIMQYINKSQVGLRKLNSLVPLIKYNLEIYGYVNDSPLNDLTSEQLDELVRKKQMPKTYKGPMDIYNKLKTYIYKGESKTINGQPNPNYTENTTGSLNIHKPQDQLLAILKKRQERSHG